jgi:hypothetical protein
MFNIEVIDKNTGRVVTRLATPEVPRAGEYLVIDSTRVSVIEVEWIYTRLQFTIAKVYVG